MSFITKYIKSTKNERINLVLAKTESNLDAWWYILVDTTKITSFHDAMKRGDCNLTDFGKILKSGFGSDSPENLKIEMQEEFGFVESTFSS